MAMLCISISAFAYDFEVDGIFYDIVNFEDRTVEVVASPNGYNGCIIIPDSVILNNRYFVVTKINSNSFVGCSSLHEVSINGYISTLPYGIFKDCVNIDKLSLRYGKSPLNIVGSHHGGLWEISYCNIYEGGLADVPINNIFIDRIIECEDSYNGGYKFNPFIKTHYWTSLNVGIDKCCPVKNVEFGNHIPKIQEALFRGCKNISSLRIGNEIQSIEQNSFDLCNLDSIHISSLTRWCQIDFQDYPQENAYLLLNNNLVHTINIGNEFSMISSKAFYKVKGISCVRFENNITMGDSTFYGIQDLMDVSFNSPSIKLGVGCFASCNHLRSVSIDNPLLQISLSKDCFADCLNLLEIKSDAIISIDQGCFKNCSSLKKVQLKRVRIINDGAFFHCKNLTELQIPQCMKIGVGAFWGCDSIVELNLNCNEIGARAFSNCINLTSIILPQISSIEECSFSDCSKLSSVRLGLYIESIASSTFNGCNNLRYLAILSPNPPDFKGDFSNNTYINGTLEVLNLSKEKYSHLIPWSRFFNIVETDAKTVEVDNLYYVLDDLANDAILIPNPIEPYNGVVKIPEQLSLSDVLYTVSGALKDSFVGSTDLRELSIPSTFSTLPRINDCKNLRIFSICDAILYCPDKYFYGLSHLKTINFGKNLLGIGREACSMCEELEDLIIPSTCESVGFDAFKGCKSLLSVTFLKSDNPILLANNGSLNLSSSITPFPNPSDVDERRTGFRNGYYDGLFYGLPIEHLVINRNIELPKYYERTMGNPTSSYSTVYNDIVYYPPFYGLTNLKSVEIGENVSAICKNQIEAVVNAVPTTMNCTNFGKCDNIEVVVAKNPKAPIGGVFSATTYKDAELFLPNGDAESYKADENWKHFSKIREAEFIPIDSISLEVEEITMNINDSCKLQPIISPANASITRLKWYSSASNIVAVSDDGIITSFSKGGEADITATTADGTNLSAMCKISIKPRIESISLNPVEWSGFKGESFKIEATVLPEDADDKTLTWTSSDESVAKVDDTGQVETTGIGKCIITATAVDGSEVNATCAVTVMRKLVESLIINPEEFLGTAGDSFIIETTVLPEDATNKKLRFSSDNTRVAKVDNNGKVTIKNEGIAYIKVMTTDGSDIKAWCVIFSTSGIENLFKDDSCRYDIYTITGMLVQKAADKEYVNRLSKGIYILVSGNKVVKLNLTDK